LTVGDRNLTADSQVEFPVMVRVKGKQAHHTV